jgi:Animal haem peroxidase
MGVWSRFLGRVFRRINRQRYWYQLWRPLGFLNLIALRINLRTNNLYDTIVTEPEAPAANACGIDSRRFRTIDGSHNDLGKPAMGMRGTRFGRNFPFTHVSPDEAAMMTPSPRVISRRLMKRERFKPATSLNMLAAAWLQFQVHDWVSHKNSGDTLSSIPLDEGDDWLSGEMKVSSTAWDLPATPDNPPRPRAALCQETHWWDASQIYGATKAQQAAMRTGSGGRMTLLDSGLLPLDENGFDATGNNNNW